MDRILVIDDDEICRRTVTTVLEHSGYVVEQADNGEDGVKLALNNPPSLIVCDIVMEKLNGLDVRDRLQEAQATSTVPFIFMTGFIDKDSAHGRRALGANAILIKPFGLSHLLATVNQCLSLP